LVKHLLRTPTVFDIVDLWPETVESSGFIRSPALLRVISRFSTLLYRRADHLCLVTNGFRNRLLERGIPAPRMTVTYFCMPDASRAEPSGQEAIEGDRPFTISYTGMIGASQNVGVLLDAVKLLPQEVNVNVKIAGSGLEYEKLVTRIHNENIKNVTFLGRLPLSEMPRLYQEADALFVHLKPDALSVVSIPSKTYFYMAAAKPVLMAVDGEATEFVNKHGFGVCAKAGDPRPIADAILHLARMSRAERAVLGQNGRRTFDSLIAGDVQVSLWESLFEKLATGELSRSDVSKAAFAVTSRNEVVKK
jgi:glycosyltransferase involved in cell wall biosynthesis